ncbi:hypothetical protein F183_A27980 [Bryobacterales bacterium F-183]|nr:hypothetical protein F183_A27980 [Bryobacterales bacterium F-183]
MLPLLAEARAHMQNSVPPSKNSVTMTLDIITCLQEPQVPTLPRGTVVGDQYGGRTFTDNVAAALERRSHCGWREYQDGETRWTLIVIER